MKISPELAALVASERYIFVRKLCALVGHSPYITLNNAVWRYTNERNTLDGVSIPNRPKDLTQSRADKIVSGEHECRAYLAQIAFDICIREWEYIPEKKDEIDLVSCMFLVRSSVKKTSDAIAMLPEQWPDNIKGKIISRIKQLSKQ